MPIEIEALATPMAAGSPRRTVSGLDYSRVSMMLAVLQARMKLPLGTLDAMCPRWAGRARWNRR
ncbi:hypothetical protein [Mobiluncus mulieris]|uniref:hypothetical protein n=1 Tax=Mobiluncus mulieris TaxID=2052 RepID=UPI0020937A69|nr:hypothetical protein [Mobiluncus mulieris]